MQIDSQYRFLNRGNYIFMIELIADIQCKTPQKVFLRSNNILMTSKRFWLNSYIKCVVEKEGKVTLSILLLT